jgi:hypothetical protein
MKRAITIGIAALVLTGIAAPAAQAATPVPGRFCKSAEVGKKVKTVKVGTTNDQPTRLRDLKRVGFMSGLGPSSCQRYKRNRRYKTEQGGHLVRDIHPVRALFTTSRLVAVELRLVGAGNVNAEILNLRFK